MNKWLSMFGFGRNSRKCDTMPDIWDAKKRSAVMARIRSSGNAETELRLIEILRKFKITGWRRNQRLPGRPDFIFPKERLVVFVDGCFWHGCPRCYRRPSSNQSYWDEKYSRNTARDRRVNRKLRALGWSVIRIWHHSLADEVSVARRISRHLSARSAVDRYTS